MNLAEKLAAVAERHEGEKEPDGKCPQWVVDLYNEAIGLYHGQVTATLPRKTKMSRDYAWCAAFASACQYAAGYGANGLYEMSCTNLIKMAIKRGEWIEADDYAARPGDLILYDWDDSGIGDNQGAVDHVGVVVSVAGNTIRVVEGNYSKQIKVREIQRNGKFIRGFINRQTKEEAKTEPDPKMVQLFSLVRGDKGQQVKALQILLNGRTGAGLVVDGGFGAKTEKAVKMAQLMYGLPENGNVTLGLWNRLING